ncbi:chemotaxis protein CheC [Liquorilactobacillus satsumensis]|uniref:Chemotaxis protein CheC n=2 Tax=Liquorilactobacillus satsumensis TaxID=259059 RepID=A0A0R1V7T3_9LACO|nr:chemotaxis protein CheC [Liquorilactobacillus satsumensis]AJA34291.1 chemotaxis protein CheC [Liquorilactobacillus satsumensis]KRL99138.1 chemotaxis protein CheC [Liquorilactobacillus satsumensis DSM 16230 = JCM 12392]MCC7666616.1 chemotaxis protein CheC [Liquorilactobacillus satsumensis]MCP9312853.1 chemotaxis protein CheC [Liquorilactobacillus satsumensis]MCP9329262.1 chemotaxis protein CheC [Liquorilactobacillus satsumensis]
MKYTSLQLDALKEVINIGGGHAATSISKLVARKIEMDVPAVKILSYHELYQDILADNVEVHAVISGIVGEYGGIVLFVVADDAVAKLAELMLGSSSSDKAVKMSAVSELTNIISNSFLGAIGKLLEVQLQSSLPVIQDDYFGAVISSAYVALDQYDDQIMVIRNEFTYAKERLDASLFLIPETGVIDRIVKSLGI